MISKNNIFLILSFLMLSLSKNSLAIELKISQKSENTTNIYLLGFEENLNQNIKNQIKSNFNKIKNINLVNSNKKECEEKEHCFIIDKNNNQIFLTYLNKITNFNGEKGQRNNFQKNIGNYNIISSHSVYESKPKNKYIPENINYNLLTANYISQYIYKNSIKENSFFLNKLTYILKNNKENTYSLNISNYDGKDNITVFKSKEPILDPSLSENQQYVAYTSYEKIVPQVFIIDLKNKTKTNVSNDLNNNGHPSWNPDKNELVYTKIKDGKSNLYLYNVNTKKRKKITNEEHYSSNPSWINSNNLAYTITNKNGYSYLMGVDFVKNVRYKLLSTTKNIILSSFSKKEGIVMLNDKKSYSLYNLNNKNKITNKIISDRNIESPSLNKENNLIVYSTQQNDINILRFIDKKGNFLFKLENEKFNIYEPTLN